MMCSVSDFPGARRLMLTMAFMAAFSACQKQTPRQSTAEPAMRTYIDPVTGQVREPTEQERAESARRAAVAQKPAAAPVEVQLPDGSFVLRHIEEHPYRACVHAGGTAQNGHSCEEKRP
jgi:hypothetical protein